MDTTTGAVCPSLYIADDEGDLGLSTFNRSVGAIVRFFCPQDGYRLYGPEVVECQYSKRWNDTIPKCFPASGSLPTTSTEQMSTIWPSETDDVDRAAVETVVLILFATGGALILSLIVLLACILRSHKKHRAERNVALGNAQQGGINQGFTSYDEIWTWIPVVTDTQATCTPPRSSNARESSSARNTETLATLTPPSYNDVMRESSNNTRLPSIHGQRPITRTNNRDRSTPIRAPVTSPVNEYDTIPADTRLPIAIPTPVRPRVSTAVVTSTSQLPVHNRPGETTLSALTRVLQSPRPGRRSALERQNQHGMDDNSSRRVREEDSNASQLRQSALSFYPRHTSTQRRQYAL